jgi:hypothetical protein
LAANGEVRAADAGADVIASTAAARAMHLAGMREIVVARIQPPGFERFDFSPQW